MAENRSEASRRGRIKTCHELFAGKPPELARGNVQIRGMARARGFAATTAVTVREPQVRRTDLIGNRSANAATGKNSHIYSSETQIAISEPFAIFSMKHESNLRKGKNMKKAMYTVVFAFAGLTGCATSAVGTSATETYRPVGHEGAPWSLSGNIYTQTVLGSPTGLQPAELVITINGKEAARGNLNSRQEGTISGNYEGRAIESVCNSNQVSPSWIQVDCMILVDNERAVTLTL